MKDHTDFFCRYYLGDQLKDSDVEFFNHYCGIKYTTKKYKDGEFIAFQNDEVDKNYILNRGTVKTRMVDETGATFPMETINAPHPLAIVFLYASKNKFPVDVIAKGDVEILFIEIRDFERQISKCNVLLRGFLKFNSDKTNFLINRFKLLIHKSIKSKFIYYISHNITENNNFELKKNITQLSEIFGVARPSLSRAISEMVDEGIIEFKNGKGKILDYNAMQELLNS